MFNNESESQTMALGLKGNPYYLYNARQGMITPVTYYQ